MLFVRGNLQSPSTFEVFVMNANGTNQVQLTNDSVIDGVPSWSPDGTKVVYSSAADNLVYPDTNGRADVFLTDRPTRAVELVTVAPYGRQANAGPVDPTLVSGITLWFPTKTG